MAKVTARPEGPKQHHGQKGGVLLVLEWALFFIMLWPNIVQAFIRKLFPPKGKNLDGKVVLVTGAGRGLGRELALSFAHEGCKVACVDINQETVLETAAEIVRDGERAKAYVTNVANVEEIKVLRAAVTKDLGPVDILVNNASLIYMHRLEDTPEDAVKAVVSVNFLSYIWMVRAFLPSMRDRDSGHIVAISSLSAHTSMSNGSLYASCKWAITGFMESVRQEVLDEGCQNVHFTTVFPTFMKTRPLSQLNSSQQMISKPPEEVAARTVAAVSRNIVSIAFPEYLYDLCIIFKLLPTKVTDWAHQLASVGRMVVSPKVLTTYDSVIKDTVK